MQKNLSDFYKRHKKFFNGTVATYYYPLMSKVLFADLVLLLLNVLWGYCFVLIKQLLTEIPPFYLLSLRFLFASLLLFPFQLPKLRRISKKESFYYFGCGLALGIGFLCQTLGMISTNPGKSGVITGTLVVFVPFIHFFWTGIRFKKFVLFGVGVTFIGLCFISLDGITNESKVNMGDLFLLCGAFAYAVHVVVVDRTYRVLTHVQPLLLVSIQLFVVGLLGIIPALSLENFPGSISPFALFGIFFLSVFGSLLAYIIQMWAQKFSPASHVGVILSTEAVFACLFSYFILAEKFTLFMWIGALLVLVGILLTQGIFDFIFSRVETEQL